MPFNAEYPSIGLASYSIPHAVFALRLMSSTLLATNMNAKLDI